MTTSLLFYSCDYGDDDSDAFLVGLTGDHFCVVEREKGELEISRSVDQDLEPYRAPDVSFKKYADELLRSVEPGGSRPGIIDLRPYQEEARKKRARTFTNE